MLKVYAVQWIYILSGLRDGHPDLLEMIKWGPWHGGQTKQVRGGTAKRIVLVRIMPRRRGREIAARVFQAFNVFATRTAVDDPNPKFENSIFQTIEKDLALPRKWRFGLVLNQRGTLFFPGLSAQPDLWEQLKKPQSLKKIRQTGEDIYRWLSASVPGIQGMPQFREALCNHPSELLKARQLWNFPRTERPSSNEKRIAFFAKTLAGLMLGIAPATSTKKLGSWTPPKLWLTDFGKTKKTK